jgi:Arc/MetJ-type ribon-helix-helix transcriptional regulator
MKRTQIYLDEDQKKALRMIAAEADSSVSEIVRKAIDTAIRQHVDGGDLAARLGEWQKRVRQRYGDFEESDVDAVLASVRERKRKRL